MPAPAGTGLDERQALLERTARAEASAWASWWRAELLRQGRPMAGGWPGTLSEARSRMARRIAADLGSDFAPTTHELDRAAREAYGAARRDWNETSEPDQAW